jgi:hypothetical protein
MKIDYYDRPEQSDPCQAHRHLYIGFDTPEEIAALNRRGTAEYILAYARVVMTQFLKEMSVPPHPGYMYVDPATQHLPPVIPTAGSQLDRGRSE